MSWEISSNVTTAVVAICGFASPILTTWLSNKHQCKLHDADIQNELKAKKELDKKTIVDQRNKLFYDFYVGVNGLLVSGAKVNRDTLQAAKTSGSLSFPDDPAPDINDHYRQMVIETAPFIRYLGVQANIQRRASGEKRVAYSFMLQNLLTDSTTDSANQFLGLYSELRKALLSLPPESLMPPYTGDTTDQDWR